MDEAFQHKCNFPAVFSPHTHFDNPQKCLDFYLTELLTVKTTIYHLKFYFTISVAKSIWPAYTKTPSKAHQTVWVHHAPVTSNGYLEEESLVNKKTKRRPPVQMKLSFLSQHHWFIACSVTATAPRMTGLWMMGRMKNSSAVNQFGL